MVDIHLAYTLANTLFGVEIPVEDFEDMAVIAFDKIGNMRYRLYRFREKIDKETLSVDLPCNCDEIEAVTYDWEDWRYSTNDTVNGNYHSQFTENYIEARKIYTDPLYMNGKYAKFLRSGDTLYFDKDYGWVNILYKGLELGDDGLPACTKKEIEAIACYVAYTVRFKDGWKQHSQAMLQEAQLLEQRWLKLCDAARVPTSISQNEMNQILDVKSSWDRKYHNKSYKPVR